jgi:methionyl-tRNA formyltransferase
MDGVRTTGVSVMCLTEGMDEGPVLATHEIEIGERETAGELGERLAELGAPLLVDALDRYAAGELKPVEQDHAAATYASKISNEDARIDWSRPAPTLDHLVRGLSPAPGAWTSYGGTRIKVFRARVEPGSGPPGTVLDPEGLVVAAGEGALALEEVQMAGKRRMQGPELARGLRASEGSIFE